MTGLAILALDLATRTGWAQLTPAGLAAGWVQLIPAGQSDPGRRMVALQAWLWPRLAELVAGRRAPASPYLVYEAPALVARRVAPFRVGCHLEAEVRRQATSWGLPPARILTPTAPEVRASVVGSGRADKQAVIAAMRERWQRPELEDDNEADALALLAWAVRELAPAGKAGSDTQVLAPVGAEEEGA